MQYSQPLRDRLQCVQTLGRSRRSNARVKGWANVRRWPASAYRLSAARDPRPTMDDSVCKDFPRVKFGVEFSRADSSLVMAMQVAQSFARSWHISGFFHCCVQSNSRNRLRLCKRPWCSLCRAGHDMSRTGEPYLKTGDRAGGSDPHAVVGRQQNRRVLLPFGPTSSCYRVEQ
jgi:hypothetical protein